VTRREDSIRLSMTENVLQKWHFLEVFFREFFHNEERLSIEKLVIFIIQISSFLSAEICRICGK